MESAIWTEKYRPSSFDEIKGQQEIVEKLKAFVAQQNLPHLLFSGPAGIGKTTLSLVIAKQLFGDTWRENTLELNASDERGIDVVRVKVKDFARTKALGNVPFKLIYLDESDALTKEAQQALRRTMENYTKTCRFILSCNYSSKIIDPIQSRCAVFRFKPLNKEDIFALIDKVAKSENLTVTDEA
ncbi:MAG: replication factor C small subunit, partial [Candidatus Woesearchaeota archaeon]